MLEGEGWWVEWWDSGIDSWPKGDKGGQTKGG